MSAQVVRLGFLGCRVRLRATGEEGVVEARWSRREWVVAIDGDPDASIHHEDDFEAVEEGA